MFIRSTALIASTVAGVLALTGTAYAAPPSPYTEVVRYGDLDLANSTDVATLDQRIRDAAARICKKAVRANLVRPLLQQTCAQEAYQESRQPLVTMLAAMERGERHAGRTPAIVVAAP